MLDVKHVVQVGNDCVVASIETVTSFLGRPYDGREMIRHKYYDKGIIMANAASLLRGSGYGVKIYGANLMCLSEEEYVLPLEKVCQLLDERKTKFEGSDLEIIDAIKTAILSGVEYVFAPPNLKKIDELLEKQQPVLIIVNSAGLYRLRGDVYIGHAVVVCGHDNGEYQVADPTKDRVQSFSPEQLLFGIYSRKVIGTSGWMMEISVD